MRRRVALIAALACLALGGCSRSAERPASTLTEAQRDTAISRSVLPGASVVGRALQVSGREASRATSMDSLPN